MLIAACSDCQTLSNPELHRRFTVDRDAVDGLGGHLLCADSSFLQQCVGNLLDNADKYSYAETEVVVSAALTSRHFVITVASTGVPLMVEDRTRCLERNWRAPRSAQFHRRGFGHRAVDRRPPDASYERPRRASPGRRCAYRRSHLAHGMINYEGESMKHFLVVEDDHLQKGPLEDRLRMTFPGADVTVLSSEHQFRDYLPALRSSPPDLVLMDVMLRWSLPSPNAPAPPPDVAEGGYYRAGLRCAHLLLAEEQLHHVPVVLYTILERSDLERDNKALPTTQLRRQEQRP